MKILFTVAFLDGYHGSVLQVYEYAKYLALQNFEVYVGALYLTGEIKHLYEKSNVHVFLVTDDLPENQFDIIWSFHYPLLSYLLNKGVSGKKVVCGSLSAYELLETFPVYWNECSFLTAHSPRTRELHNINYQIPLEKIFVYPNPLPNEFVEFPFSFDKSKIVPKNIAVVSNHVPDEVMSAVKLFDRKTKVDIYGCEKSFFLMRQRSVVCGWMGKLISPQILSKYDCIITIGKTVQYALGMGIPVFEYDCYGGCGYILVENYEAEKFRNFCGLATERKLSAEEIKDEIVNNFTLAVNNLEELKKSAVKDFLLSTQLQRFISQIESCPEINLDYNKLKDYKLSIMHDSAFVNYVKKHKETIDVLQKKYDTVAPPVIRNIYKFIKGIFKRIAYGTNK